MKIIYFVSDFAILSYVYLKNSVYIVFDIWYLISGTGVTNEQKETCGFSTGSVVFRL